MNILIPDDYQLACKGLACLHKLSAYYLRIVGNLQQQANLSALLAETEAMVLIRERTKVDATLLAQMPRLRLIAQTGKLARNVDLAACKAAGVDVVEGVGSPHAPAELSWLLMMAARRRFVEAVNGLYQGRWQCNIGQGMHGATLGILGYGKIGKLIGDYGRAFGMKVLVWGSERAREEAKQAGHQAALTRAEFFSMADIVTVHLRLLPATEGSISVSDLQRMKANALFVNTSRAELVAKGALEAALASGHPGFAALDVFESEPLYDPEHPLLHNPRVLCSPHLGYVEQASYELYLGSAFDQLLRYLAGDRSHVLS